MAKRGRGAAPSRGRGASGRGRGGSVPVGTAPSPLPGRRRRSKTPPPTGFESQLQAGLWADVDRRAPCSARAFRRGELLETFIPPEDSSAPVGLGLFRVRGSAGSSHTAAGFFVEPVGGESDVVRSILAPLKEKGLRDRVAVHVCGESALTCKFCLPGERVFHVSRVRRYLPASPPAYAVRGLGAGPAGVGGTLSVDGSSLGKDAAMGAINQAAEALGFGAEGPKAGGAPPGGETPKQDGLQGRSALPGTAAGLLGEEARIPQRQGQSAEGDPTGGAASMTEMYQKAKGRVRRRRVHSRSRGRRRRDRSRSRRRRSSSSSGSSTRSVGAGPGTHMGGSRAQDTARRAPGRILQEGLANMQQYLPQVTAGGNTSLFRPTVTQYLIQVLHKATKDLGRRNERELRTLAMALDAMLQSNYLLAADTLMARFTALELSVMDSNWAVSQHLELIPKQAAGVASERAKAHAAREEATAARLRRNTSRPGSGGGGQQQGRRRSRERRGANE